MKTIILSIISVGSLLMGSTICEPKEMISLGVVSNINSKFTAVYKKTEYGVKIGNQKWFKDSIEKKATLFTTSNNENLILLVKTEDLDAPKAYMVIDTKKDTTLYFKCK